MEGSDVADSWEDADTEVLKISHLLRRIMNKDLRLLPILCLCFTGLRETYGITTEVPISPTF